MTTKQTKTDDNTDQAEATPTKCDHDYKYIVDKGGKRITQSSPLGNQRCAKCRAVRYVASPAS